MQMTSLYEIVTRDLPKEVVQIEEIFVNGWQNPAWTEACSLGLLSICETYSVRKLDFGPPAERPYRELFLGMLKTFGGKECATLREISVAGTILAQSGIWNVIRLSKVRHIRFYDLSSGIVTHFLLESLERRIEWSRNFHLREITMGDEEETRSVSQMKCIVGECLKRNQSAFRACQAVTTCLLGLRKHRKISLHRDELSIVVNMVWSTRGTVIWNTECK